MVETLATLLIELLFLLVFVASLVDYIRRRDPLSLDLVGVFGSVAALFILQLVPLLLGENPALLRAASVALLLAQPLFTLRLATRLRSVPRIVSLSALAGFLATAVPLAVLPSPRPVALTLAAVGVFAVSSLLGAGYLGQEARRRTGAARFRLALASVSTALFAIAILAAGAGSAAGGDVGQTVARLVALAAGIGYVIAFLPPAPLRRAWQGMTAYRFGLRLLERADGADDHRAAWSRFAAVAREIAGAETAAVIGREDGEIRLVAVIGTDPGVATGGWSIDAFDHLLADGRLETDRPIELASPIARDLAGRTGARFVSIVAFPEDVGALVLSSRYRSLFGAEDRALLALLAAQVNTIADRERLHAEQAQLSERLRAANEAKSDFIASMSHELRTPLSAILGFSDLMRNEPKEGDGRVVPDEWIEHVHRSGEHLLALINDVLDLAKVEAGRLELEPTSFDLRSLISETVAGLRPLAERKHLKLTTAVAAERLVADRGRVRQVLYNLLSNAIKFTPDGGSVSVEASVSEDGIRMAVVDSGPGIAPEDQAAVFEEFRQLGDATARAEGTGLGLALTRRLVEAHGGWMELTSVPGEGSRFAAVFPQAPLAEALPTPDVRPQHPALEEVLAQPDLPDGAHVLVIEDDPSAVRLLRTYLEGDGYAVRFAIDGPTGLAAARAYPPAAILLDILLPGMDGWEVLRELKADPGLRDVPVIVVTVVDERHLGLALGATDYFLKPVDREALLERLARYSLTTKVRQRTVRILAVDDDASALDLVEAALQPEGFEIVRAAGGRAALERMHDGKFDFVICDLLMPDLDGFEVVAALKADPLTHDVPILILTAHPLSASEKVRLNGQILGIVEKGADGAAGLRRWLARLATAPVAHDPDAGPS